MGLGPWVSVQMDRAVESDDGAAEQIEVVDQQGREDHTVHFERHLVPSEKLLDHRNLREKIRINRSGTYLIDCTPAWH